MNQTTRRPLGEMLVEAGLISAEELHAALDKQRQQGGRLGAILVESGRLVEDVVVRVLHRQLGIEVIDLKQTKVHPKVLSLVPRRMALDLRALPVGLKRDRDGEVLYIAMSTPTDDVAIQAVQQKTGKRVRPMLAGDTALLQLIEKAYPPESETSATDLDAIAVDVDDEDFAVVEVDVSATFEPAPAPPQPAPHRNGGGPQGSATVLPANVSRPPVITDEIVVTRLPAASAAAAATGRSPPVSPATPPPPSEAPAVRPASSPPISASAAVSMNSIPPERTSALVTASLAAVQEAGRLSLEQMIADQRATYERAANAAVVAALEEASRQAQEATAARETELNGEFQERTAKLTRDHDEEKTRLNGEHARALDAVKEELSEARRDGEDKGKKLESVRGELKQVRADLAASADACEETLRELEKTREQLDQARARVADNAKLASEALDKLGAAQSMLQGIRKNAD